mmetsp:Transcript_80313/g.167260  ORF Transcript_80313/g.167260 Transcript_80313/m.167260 type:complete len:318 (+) Transcript_80313:77-1030(+)
MGGSSSSSRSSGSGSINDNRRIDAVGPHSGRGHLCQGGLHGIEGLLPCIYLWGSSRSNPLRSTSGTDNSGVGHCEAETVWGRNEVQGLLTSFEQHDGASFTHLLHGLSSESDNLALRFPGDSRDVLANLGLLEQGVRDLGHLDVEAEASNSDVKFVVVLVKVQHLGPVSQILRSQDSGVETLFALLLAVCGCEKCESTEAVAVGPSRAVGDLLLHLVDRGSLASATKTNQDDNATALLGKLLDHLLGHLISALAEHINAGVGGWRQVAGQDTLLDGLRHTLSQLLGILLISLNDSTQLLLCELVELGSARERCDDGP